VYRIFLELCKVDHGVLSKTIARITGPTGGSNIKVSDLIGQSLDNAKAPFSPKFLWAFVRMDPVNVPAKFEVSFVLFCYACYVTVTYPFLR